jgi:hypothetical protein
MLNVMKLLPKCAFVTFVEIGKCLFGLPGSVAVLVRIL